ncbi:MAG TPA: ElyC/SanA/YdcF family protein [Propionibacteriaceae bacterium]|nr:ElyC/SanA/YdcF family protein [Propionibacteriaceae bacterium]
MTVPMALPGRRRRRALGRVAAAVCVLGVLAFSPTLYAWGATVGRTYTRTSVPERAVAIVFGAEVLPNKTPSSYLRARLDLAYELWRTGKVKAVLVSGDNAEVHYNEPDIMRSYLLRRGIPESKVVADYAGFDTYDTCVRAVRIFGVTSATLVTQSYHMPRALATCRTVGVDAVGVGDDSVQAGNPNLWRRSALREVAAGVKMAYDLMSRRDPILGDRETGIDNALGR